MDIKNLPPSDYQYHFGKKYIGDYGLKYIKDSKKKFMLQKRKLIHRLHRLVHKTRLKEKLYE